MEQKENLNIKEGKDKSSCVKASEDKKQKSRLKKIIKGIIEWTIYAIIFAIIVWGTPAGLKKALNTDYPIASITSSSMWPVLKENDIILIKGANSKDDIQEGDIVVWQNEQGFTIHRVVDKYENTFVTKGDANNVKDTPVSYDKLVGKTLNYKGKPIRIPMLGKLSQLRRQ